MIPEHRARSHEDTIAATNDRDINDGQISTMVSPEKNTSILTPTTTETAATTSANDEKATSKRSTRKEVACQTDPITNVSCSDFMMQNNANTKLESRATQTEPSTRSVFTRSSRFLPVSTENVQDRPPPTTSMTPSHRGDSTAVLSR